MGFFGGLIFGPGIFWALLEDQGILPPFNHSRHSKSGVLPRDLIHALLTLALEKLINLFLNEFCVKTSCIKLFSSSANSVFMRTLLLQREIRVLN